MRRLSRFSFLKSDKVVANDSASGPRFDGSSLAKPDIDGVQRAETRGSQASTATLRPESEADKAADNQAEAADNSPCGLEELIGQPPDETGCVDIIAIHGLNGHRDKTWTDPTTGLNWLSDERCLRKDIPTARVLTFGYNSKSYFSRSNANVRDFASELLAEVKASRKCPTERQRPIIFVCHSLGGLVFKQAVVRAHEQNEYYSNILDSIRGVIFLGVPHRGSDLAFWDQIGTTLVRVGTFGYLTNTKLSRDLKVDAEMLKRISDSFAHRGGKFMIRSFYETERMTGLNCRVVEKDSATLGWPNEVDIAASAHHSGICKFATPSDQRYQTTIFAIKEMIEELDTTRDIPFTPQEEACMRDLNSDYERHLGQVDDHIPGTCEWVLSHEKWHQWNSARESSLLWITADAGCGKSVIAKFLVAHFQTQRSTWPQRTVCYFFFKEGLDDQDNAASAISAVLHQIYCSQPRLIKHAMTKYTSTPKRSFNRFSSLWFILINTLEDNDIKDIVWVLDGLDECEQKSLNEFIKALGAYFDSNSVSRTTAKRALKVALLSRPHNLIQQRLQLTGKDDLGDMALKLGCCHKLRLMAEDESIAIAKDIALFARAKIAEFGPRSELSEDVLQRLEDRLINGADFTFLWISLVIKLVEDAEVDGISMEQLESILQTTDLNDMYERLLASRKLPLKTRKVLLIVLAAVRPLTVREMCVAVEVHQDYYPATDDEANARLAEYSGANLQLPSTKSVRPPKPKPIRNRTKQHKGFSISRPEGKIDSLGGLERVLHQPFANHLRLICGHFLRIRGRRIYLVHQTARDFLLDKHSREDSRLSFLQSSSWLLKPPIEPSHPSSLEVATANSGEKWCQSIQLEDANRYMLQICVDYITLFEFEVSINGVLWTENQIRTYLEDCRDDPPRAFFKYAALHWVEHYRPIRRKLDFCFDYLLQPRGVLFKVWIIVHQSWTSEEERTRLEAGGVRIEEKEPEVTRDILSVNASHFKSKTADKKAEDKKAEELQEVLDHFNLASKQDTELWDDEFLTGDRYWKKSDSSLFEDAEDDILSDERDELPVDSLRHIPDRIQNYRRQHRKEILEGIAESQNPLSPGRGNPTSYSNSSPSILFGDNPRESIKQLRGEALG